MKLPYYSEYNLSGSGWVLSVATGINRRGTHCGWRTRKAGTGATASGCRVIPEGFPFANRKSGRQKLETLLYLLGAEDNTQLEPRTIVFTMMKSPLVY